MFQNSGVEIFAENCVLGRSRPVSHFQGAYVEVAVALKDAFGAREMFLLQYFESLLGKIGHVSISVS